GRLLEVLALLTAGAGGRGLGRACGAPGHRLPLPLLLPLRPARGLGEGVWVGLDRLGWTGAALSRWHRRAGRGRRGAVGLAFAADLLLGEGLGARLEAAVAGRGEVLAAAVDVDRARAAHHRGDVAGAVVGG